LIKSLLEQKSRVNGLPDDEILGDDTRGGGLARR